MVARIPNDFFKTWTPEMAYVLGYWWADGGMLRTPQSCRVTFTSKDGDHLERIAHTLGVGKVVPTGNGCFQLTIYRKSMYDDLLTLGGTPRKSLTANWHTPQSDYLKDFVRGFIDGDGSLGSGCMSNGANSRPPMTARSCPVCGVLTHCHAAKLPAP
jgi:hypothetical protein